MEEKDFLQGYEIRPWEFSPRIYKIIAAAAVFNILGLLVLAQTNMMSASACESPFVKNVCSVLDTVYVGSKLLSNDKDYVVKDYNRTKIEDADVVWVDTTQVEPQMTYPVGYFEIANKEELERQRQIEELEANGFSTSPPINQNNPVPPVTKKTPPYIPPTINRSNPTRRGGGGDNLARKKPTFPDKKDKVTTGEINDGLLSEDRDENDKDKNPIKDNSANNSDPVTEVEINKKPLLDLGESVLAKWEKDKNLLSKNFAVKVNVKLKKDGRFDEKATKYVAQNGDEDIVNVAKEAIEAVSASGWMTYLANIGVDKFELTVVQNDENIEFLIVSPQTSQAVARSTASGLRNSMLVAKPFIKGKDELTLLDSAKVTSQDKNFILKATLPKDVAKEMIDRNLQETSAKKQKEQSTQNPAQPNSSTNKKDSKDNAVK